MTNYTSLTTNVFFPLNNLNNVYLDTIEMIDCKFMAGSFLAPETTMTYSEIKNGYYENLIVGDIFLYHYEIMKDFSLVNHTFSNSQSTEGDDSSGGFLKIVSFSVENLTQTSLQDINFQGSPISLISVDEVAGEPDELYTLNILNIKYTDIDLSFSKTLILFEKLYTEANIEFILTGVNFTNINYTSSSGDLIRVGNQMKNPIKFKNIKFSNISSGRINLETFNTELSLETKVLFENIEFSDIYSPATPSFSVSKSSSVTIINGTFSKVTSTNDASGIFNLETGAKLNISDSVFNENSAITSSIFKVNADWVLYWTNCNISSNFAISNGVLSTSSDGIFHFMNSYIFNNFAIRNPIGEILLNDIESTIKTTNIYSNNFILANSIKGETETWSKLWFLQSKMIEYLSKTNFTDFEESQPAIQIIFGSLLISDSSTISDQLVFLNSFSSQVIISDSLIKDISWSGTSIEVSSSTLTLNNVDIFNITNTNEEEFIFITFDSILNGMNVNFENSTSILFNILSSQATLEGLKYSNIEYTKELMKVLDWDYLMLNNITFINSTSGAKAYITVDDSKDVSIIDTQISELPKTFIWIRETNVTLMNNLEFRNNTQVFDIRESEVESISNSSFMGNGADTLLKGGAFNLFNSKVDISNSSFNSNKALRGGAISFEWDSLTKCSLDLNNNTFENNIAIEHGGAINYNYLNPSSTGNTFRNNSAQYGNNFASYPVRIGKINSMANEKIYLTNVGPGITLSSGLELALIDYDNQVISTDQSSQILIIAKNQSNSRIGGTNAIVVKNGIANFDSLSAVSEPGSPNIPFLVSSQGIDESKVLSVFNSTVTQPDLIMDFRFWSPGERILDDQCSPWDTGTYSLEWNSTECKKWEDHASWLEGNLIVDSGYWRRSNSTSFISKWLEKEACLGDDSENSNEGPVCKLGYEGILWSEWSIISKNKYNRIPEFECRKWPSPFLNAVSVIGLWLLVLSFLMILIIINVRKTRESELSTLIRILTNYLHIMTNSLAMSTSFPESFHSIFGPINQMGAPSDTLLSFDWFVRDFEITGPFSSNSAFKLFLLVFLPIILFIIIALVWVVVYLINANYVKDMKRNLVISFVSIIFLLHPKLAEQSVNAFRWLEVDNGYDVSRMDMSVKWYSSTYFMRWFLLAIPILIAWVISVPVIIFVLLLKNIKKDEDNVIKKDLLIIYQGLRPECFYWEFINTIRKMLLLITLLMSDEFKFWLASVLLIGTARLQLTLKPYKIQTNNHVEVLAVSAAIVTILSGLVFQEEDEVNTLNQIWFFIVIFLNVVFILRWASLLFKIYEEKSDIIPKVNLLSQ